MGKENHSRREQRRRRFDQASSSQEYTEPDFFQRPMPSPAIDAEVKWFNAAKGFGFVKLADGSEAFLHIRALENAGQRDVVEGTPLKVRVEQGQKGQQVKDVIEVGQTTAPSFVGRPERSGVGDGEALEAAGIVKWFDHGKGFGFISVDGAHKDVFVHVSTLNRSGLDGLEEGQNVMVRYFQGQKGLEALTVSRR